MKLPIAVVSGLDRHANMSVARELLGHAREALVVHCLDHADLGVVSRTVEYSSGQLDAAVGACGLTKAAIIRGTGVQVPLHQEIGPEQDGLEIDWLDGCDDGGQAQLAYQRRLLGEGLGELFCFSTDRQVGAPTDGLAGMVFFSMLFSSATAGMIAGHHNSGARRPSRSGSSVSGGAQ